MMASHFDPAIGLKDFVVSWLNFDQKMIQAILASLIHLLLNP
jgi:hypothetical protein